MRLLIFMKSSKSKERGAPPLSSPTHTTPLPITTIMSDGGGAAAGGPPPSGQQSMTSFLPPHDGAAAVTAPLAPHGANTESAKLTFPGKVPVATRDAVLSYVAPPGFRIHSLTANARSGFCILRGEVGCTARRRDGAPLRQAFCLPRERRVSKLAAAAEAQKRVVHRSHTALERRPRHHHGVHQRKTTEVSVAD